MFCHVVLFRWVPGATAEQQQAVAAGLDKLPELISTLRSYRHGPDAAVNEGNHEYAVVATFEDIDGYLVYRDHAAHKAVVAEHILPILAERAAVQYHIDH